MLQTDHTLPENPDDIRKLQRYEYSLLAACEALHMATTGAYDGPTMAHCRALAWLIQERLRTWEDRPGYNFDIYDDAVKAMAQAALAHHVAACWCHDPPLAPT